MKKLISVIVSIYNIDQYIEACIESILMQTYKDIEIILVDDGSSDNSGEICDNYAEKDDRIIVIHKKNAGLASARNKGLSIAKGDYILFFDGDDIAEKDYIEVLFNAIQGYDIAMCGFQLVTEKDEKIREVSLEKNILKISEVNSDKILSLVDNSALGFTWNKLYRKRVIDKMQFENLMPREDLVFNLFLLSKIEAIAIVGDYTGYHWVQRNGSITHSSNVKNVNKIMNISKRLLEIDNLKHFSFWNQIFDKTLKVLISDAILVDIVGNEDLSLKEKRKYIRVFIGERELVRKLKIQSANKYIGFMVLCLKLKLSTVLLFVSQKLSKK